MTGHMYLWISVRRNYSDGWLRERDCEAARSGTSDERGYGYPNHRLCLPWTHSDWLRRYVSICNDWVVQWIVCFAYQKLHHPKNETKQPGAFHHDTWHYIIVIHHRVVKSHFQVKWCFQIKLVFSNKRVCKRGGAGRTRKKCFFSNINIRKLTQKQVLWTGASTSVARVTLRKGVHVMINHESS